MISAFSHTEEKNDNKTQLWRTNWVSGSTITQSNYWKNKHDAPISDIHDIDRDSGAAAIKRLPPSKRQWAAKFAIGFIGNNHMRAKRGEIVLPTCPLCNSEI